MDLLGGGLRKLRKTGVQTPRNAAAVTLAGVTLLLRPIGAAVTVLASVVILSWATAPTAPAEQPWVVAEAPLAWPSDPGIPASAPALVDEAPPASEWMVVPALLTAYTPGPESCGESADGLTSTLRRTDAHPYGIAADPVVLPYGSRVLVPGYMASRYPGRAWEVDDTGGAMRQSRRVHGVVHLDLRYRTIYSALRVAPQWQEVSVEVTGWSDVAKARLRRAAGAGQRMREQGRLP